jgi:hypothetical protein
MDMNQYSRLSCAIAAGLGVHSVGAAATVALRAVIYDDSRGGYIHNVPGTFARSGSDIGIVDYFGGVVPPGSATVSNNALVNHAYNPTTYQGFRLSASKTFNMCRTPMRTCGHDV